MSRTTFYDRLRFIGSNKGSWDVDPLESKIWPPITNLIEITRLIQFTSRYVTEEEEGRPDLIAYKEYGSVDLWWVIMEANSIMHHLDVEAGLLIKIPISSNVDDLLSNSLVRNSHNTSIRRTITL